MLYTIDLDACETCMPGTNAQDRQKLRSYKTATWSMNPEKNRIIYEMEGRDGLRKRMQKAEEEFLLVFLIIEGRRWEVFETHNVTACHNCRWIVKNVQPTTPLFEYIITFCYQLLIYIYIMLKCLCTFIRNHNYMDTQQSDCCYRMSVYA